MNRNTPIIILAGPAGSGKDTVGSYLAATYNAIAVAQADPLKRFARTVFHFSDEQLWGPSDLRNRLVPANPNYSSFNVLANAWLHDVFDGRVPEMAFEQLVGWFDAIMELSDRTGKISPRAVLQTLGTEWGRQQDKDLWVNYATRVARLLLGGQHSYSRTRGVFLAPNSAGPDYVVITDGRFRNEILSVRFCGGTALKIDRPQLTPDAVDAAGIKGHRSETELLGVPDHFYTETVVNDGPFETLFRRVSSVMQTAYGATPFSGRL